MAAHCRLFRGSIALIKRHLYDGPMKRKSSTRKLTLQPTWIGPSDLRQSDRRIFLKAWAASALTIGLDACGGNADKLFKLGGDASTQAAPSASAQSAQSPPADTLIPAQNPAGKLTTSFQLQSSVGGENLPFTIGQAFRKGHVPQGSAVIGSGTDLQVICKNVWPDGSLKFALVSGVVKLAPASPLTVKLATTTITSPKSANVIGIAELKASGIAVVIDAKSYGSAIWSGVAWDAPFATWVSGPQMSSWIYRKTVGTDAHLVAWLEVRMYAAGNIEILPWIENGYLLVPLPSSKNAVYSFSINGIQRFSQAINLANHARTVLVSGTALSHWVGNDPLVVIKHDTAYLQSTRLVPAYRVTKPEQSLFSALPNTFAPLQQGGYPGEMGTAGYHPSIGILPQWDVLYLTSGDERAFRAVIFNAYSSGRYGIHFRDEKTNRPFLFSSYPNLVLGGKGEGLTGTGASSKEAYTPAATGTVPATWTSTHHPSVGFTAYLVTGRYYFMEEVQFAATIHFLKNTDIVREFGKGILKTNAGANTTRGMAWATRTLAQAACATPDDDAALRTEFLSSIESNIDYYHRIYVAQPNNPYGFLAPYTDYSGVGDNILMVSTWQQDFVTAAYGYLQDMEPSISGPSSTKLAQFFRWKAASVVGRYGRTGLVTEFPFTEAAPYTIAIAPSDTVDFMGGTGPWYPSWGGIYSATKGGGATNTVASNALIGGNFPEAGSYWGNSAPALAYAVEHGAPGAREAYARLTGASNWNLLEVGFDNSPEWSVVPRNAA